MGRATRLAAVAAIGLALTVLAPSADAAVYFDATSLNAALNSRPTSTAVLPASRVSFQDAFGTWTAATQNTPVVVGTNGYPYTDPARTANRSIVTEPSVTTGVLAANFSCEPFTLTCLGAYRATFTFSEAILGFGGNLHTGSDTLLRADALFPQLGIAGALFNSPNPYQLDTFYAILFDAPTTSFTVDWTTAGERTSLDAFSNFIIRDAFIIVPGNRMAVPEPASLALFGVGLLGMIGVRTRRRPSLP